MKSISRSPSSASSQKKPASRSPKVRARALKARASDQEDGESTGRPLWSGTLSFGLLNIPLTLSSAKDEKDLSFQLLDKRDYGHIGYRQYNKASGKEVTRDKVVKGYEYEKGKFVVVTDEDFRKANPRATSTIDLEDFVELDQLDPMLFESPYYLQPAKNGEKGYRLLHEVMKETRKVAIGKVVLFRKQRLVAVMVRGEYLVLETLRFDREILTADEMTGLKSRLAGVKISAKEVQMAKALVEGMTSDWDHRKYEDTYQAQLLAFIRAKAKKGGVEALESADAETDQPKASGNLVDLMPLLKKSLEAGRRKSTEKRA